MPAEKGKVVSVSHRYRPASAYDDATLAQKREYWRNKKREQRARLSEQGKKQTQDNQGEELPHLYVPAEVNPILSDSFAVFSPAVQSDHEPCTSAPQSGNATGHSSLEVAGNQKERWLQTTKVSKIIPHPPPASIVAKAAERNTDSLTCPIKSSVCKATLPVSSGSQLNISSSVPPVRNSGSSTKTTPQPCVKGTPALKTKSKAEVGLPTGVTTDINVLSPRGHVSFKKEDKSANTTPQSGTNSALVTTQKAEDVTSTRPSLESEEERAARRREQWRIKKREQRAKVAARIAKYIERMPAGEVTSQRLTAQKPGPMASSVPPPPSLLRGAGQKQCPVRTKMPRQTDKLQNGKAIVAVELQTDQMKVQPLHGNRIIQTFDVTSVKKPADPHRKLPSYTHHHNVTRGIARCKTPRQRLIETQKNIMNQRNLRCKTPSMASVFSTRGMPRIDPNDTPEQIIAKRREYWRIKKREQRAKLSMEMKTRLKEKDSLMRRVKRYQQILEGMRKARVLAHPTGSAGAHASETIGGFIKEDGTLTVDTPQSSKFQNEAGENSEGVLTVLSKKTPITETQHRRGFASVRKKPPPPCPSRVKASFPLAIHPINRPARGVSIKPYTHLETTTVPNSQSSVVKDFNGLTLTHPPSPQSAPSAGSAAGSNLGGCVMKMAISTSTRSLSVLSLDSGMTDEERMAKKREYWRIKKREQRAARAVRLKQGVLQARLHAGLQRRRAQRQLNTSATNHAGNAQTGPNSTAPVVSHATEIKQETESVPAVDPNSQPEQAICPDIKPPAFPPAPPAAQPEADPSVSADSQATTLLAVASMRKLLEESLSTFTECENEQTDIKTETVEDPSEQNMKPSLHHPFFENDDMTPIAVDLKLQMKNCQPDLLDQHDTPQHQLRNPLQNNDTFSPASCSSELLRSTCGGSSQTPSDSTANFSMEASEGPASACMTQRLYTKRAGCSPELSELHHISATSLDQLQQQHRQTQKQWQDSNLPPALQHCSTAGEQSSFSSLQKKREYWKLMKRQQRARLKARQKDRRGEGGSVLSPRNVQAPGLKGVSQTKTPLLTGPPVPPGTAEMGVQTACKAEQPPDAPQDELPVTSREEDDIDAGPSQNITSFARVCESLQEWNLKSTIVDSVSSLPTLSPPENPLSSINLQPIESPGQSPTSSLSPVKIPGAQLQSPENVQPSTRFTPISSMVPPKAIPGESEEDFLRRKREYWRVKKKEQRARKAIQEKRVTSKRRSNNRRPVQPVHDVQPVHNVQPVQDLQTRAGDTDSAAQDSGQWVNSPGESEPLTSLSVDTHAAPFPFPEYTAQVEDELELLFSDHESYNDEEGPLSDAVWRNRYLMDYDPLNQLLVCMVCGELQYSHSLEGVRAHIDEAHSHTLTLEPREKQRILEAWDEQVSQRERFFTSQLQQRSEALEEAHRN